MTGARAMKTRPVSRSQTMRPLRHINCAVIHLPVANEPERNHVARRKATRGGQLRRRRGPSQGRSAFARADSMRAVQIALSGV